MPEKNEQEGNRRSWRPSLGYVLGIFNCLAYGTFFWWSSGIPGTRHATFRWFFGVANIIMGIVLSYLLLRSVMTPLKPVLRGPWGVRRRRRRSRQGLCVKCGYDLEGLSHLHCPECGHQNVPYEDFDEYAPLDGRGEE